MPDTTLLPEGVTTYTLEGEHPYTVYYLDGKTILGAQGSIAHPGLITTVIYATAGNHAVVRVTAAQLPNLLAVLADLHRTAVTA